MYDNGTGRFLSRDPKQGTMSDPLSRNAYLYARANPFRYTDPTGMSFISQAGTVVTQAVGAGRQLYRGAAALGHRVKQTWNRVMGDQVSYYPVLECGMIRYAAVTQRGLGSRIKQGFGGVMMIVGGADFVLTGGGIIVGSEGLGTYLGGGMIAAGISSIGYGTAELMEAFTDYNPVRDGIMTGNRKLYYGGMNATNIAMLGLGLANLGYQLYGTYGGAVKAKAGEFFADETGGGIGQGGSGANKWPSAKGLVGHDFEDYLHKTIGGESQYIKGSTAGRDFDGVFGKRWYEAKSGNYWNKLLQNKSMELNFKQKMAEGLKIAQENGATYELFSNSPIPENIKAWLTKKGIPFTEILD